VKIIINIPEIKVDKSKWQSVSDAIFYAFHNFFNRCHVCHWRRSVWFYMPGMDNACEECVPRGCSCNREIKPEFEEEYTEDMANGIRNPKWDISDKELFYDVTDEKGRKMPCCEWHYVNENIIVHIYEIIKYSIISLYYKLKIKLENLIEVK
jgi:hypothetical protein